MTARKPPSGRRIGDSGTRDAILEAARELFSALGYDGTSIRAIATAAGVDPALIRHFFGDKETLFATAMAERTTIPERILGAFAGDAEQLGHRVADTYLRLWEDPDIRPVLQALVRSAATSERAANMLNEVLGARIRLRGSELDFDDEQMQRVALAAAHMLGIAIARYIIKMPALAAQPHDDLLAEIAPTIHRYLTAQHR